MFLALRNRDLQRRSEERELTRPRYEGLQSSERAGYVIVL